MAAIPCQATKDDVRLFAAKARADLVRLSYSQWVSPKRVLSLLSLTAEYRLMKSGTQLQQFVRGYFRGIEDARWYGLVYGCVPFSGADDVQQEFDKRVSKAKQIDASAELIILRLCLETGETQWMQHKSRPLAMCAE